MITTEMGLKLPSEEDFYDIADFNFNFSKIETLLEDINARITELSKAPVVTGAVTAAGTINVGFQPKVVMIFASTIAATNSSVSGQTVFSPGNAIAMAFQSRPQKDHTGQIVLQIVQNGFTVGSLAGDASSTSSPGPNSSNPLRYIAWR